MAVRRSARRGAHRRGQDRGARGGQRDGAAVLERDADIVVDGARTHYAWHFNVTPDTPPRIAFRAPPRTGPNNSLTLDYMIEDDYGAASAEALVAARDESANRDDAGPARPLYGPPEIKLALPQTRGGPGEAITNANVVDHPWAGSRVVVTLLVRDETGQEGRSEL